MNYLLSFILVLICSVTAFSQSDKEDAKQTYEAYFKLLQTQGLDASNSLEYIYPKLFDLYPKDAMAEAIKKQKEDTTIQIKLGNSEITKVSEILEVGDVKYTLIDYSFDMEMILKPAKEDADGIEQSQELLVEMYGKENVKIVKKGDIIIHKENQAYAIKDPKYSGWKFLDKEEAMMPILKKLLPKKVLKKLK